MLDRLRYTYQRYPHQFWLLFWGMLISTIGSSMIWPFLMIYVSGRLGLPLTSVALLMTINAAAGLVCSFAAGPFIDRVGRKWVMVASLLANGLVYFFMSRAGTLLEFGILQAMAGAVNPLYRVGADAMMADLIPPDDRVEAYSMMRLSNNVGVSIGPAIGGLIASTSYTLAFYFATFGLITYGLLVAFWGHETLPEHVRIAAQKKDALGGYGRILRDRPFITFVLNFTVIQIPSAILWVLMAVYLKRVYNMPESLYGLLPTTNALLVVFFQMWVTRITRRYRPLSMLALGSVLYAVAVGSVALGRGFWAFLASMVVMTIGELILMPTSTTYAANLAPAEMRGRYMSLYGLTWGVAAGIGPVMGGYLGDHFGQQTMWYGGFLIGMVSVVGFLVMTLRDRERRRVKAEVETAAPE
jgi:MFS family permease